MKDPEEEWEERAPVERMKQVRAGLFKEFQLVRLPTPQGSALNQQKASNLVEQTEGKDFKKSESEKWMKSLLNFLTSSD